jgi:hypothetical protein
VNKRATFVLGALVAGGYLCVAFATAHVSGHKVLPLYEGVPAPAYQWVNPPTAFATGNVVPKANTTKIALGASGNREGGIASDDTQFIVTLNAGAIPGKTGATQASVRIEPLDPATLSALPGGAHADGNAYRLTITYDSVGGTVTRFAAKTSTVLQVPLPANRGVYFSTDGQQWSQVIPPPPATEKTTVGGSIQTTGVFLAATTHVASAGGGSSGTSVGIVIIGVLVGLLLVGGGVWFLLRLVRPAPPARPTTSSRPSGGKRPPPKGSRR